MLKDSVLMSCNEHLRERLDVGSDRKNRKRKMGVDSDADKGVARIDHYSLRIRLGGGHSISKLYSRAALILGDLPSLIVPLPELDFLSVSIPWSERYSERAPGLPVPAACTPGSCAA